MSSLKSAILFPELLQNGQVFLIVQIRLGLPVSFSIVNLVPLWLCRGPYVMSHKLIYWYRATPPLIKSQFRVGSKVAC